MTARRTVLCGEISMGFPRDLRWNWSRETWRWIGHVTVWLDILQRWILVSVIGYDGSFRVISWHAGHNEL